MSAGSHPASLLRFVAVTASGLILALCGTTPWLWPLAFVALVPGMWALQGAGAYAALVLGWWLGLVVNACGQTWILEVVARFGHASGASSALVLAGVAAYQGLVFGVWALVTRVVEDRSRAGRPFATAAAMVAAEKLVPFLLPWGLALLVVPFWPALQIAELTGSAGVSFFVVLVNRTVFLLLDAVWRRRQPALSGWVSPVTVIGVTLVFGLVRGRQIDRLAEQAPRLRIGIVQPNFGVITRKLRAEKGDIIMDRLRGGGTQAAARGAELVLWPEAAWPVPVDAALEREYPPGHPWRLRKGFATPLLTGAFAIDLTREQGGQVTNSAILIDREDRITGRYDKNRLFPFGEYVPLGGRFPAWRDRYLRQATDADEFVAGREPKILALGAARIAPFICYEDILADQVRRAAHLRPNLFVTLANLSWFGGSSAPRQQLHLAALRAVEHRHELVRATATGVSGRIDALGRIRETTRLVAPSQGEFQEPEVLVVDARLVDMGPTIHGRTGDAFSWACQGLVVLLVLIRLARPRR